MKQTIAILTALLLGSGCTTSAPDRLSGNAQERLFYSHYGMGLVPNPECSLGKCEFPNGPDEVALYYDNDTYWIHAETYEGETACIVNLDSPTALRVLAAWKRSAPLLDSVARDTEETNIADPEFYTFRGYSREDLQSSMPPNDNFWTIVAVVSGMQRYCHKRSSASRRSMERSLEALEASYAKR